MSAYLVEDEVINRIVNWLVFSKNAEWVEELFSNTGEDIRNLGININDNDWGAQLGLAMFELNKQALVERYGSADGFRSLDYKYKPSVQDPIAQVLKSLECWLYQCYEGKVPEAPLFKVFDHNIRISIMKQMIEPMPTYSLARWG